MKSVSVVCVLLASSPAFADSRCISLSGSSLNNGCEKCADVTLREMQAPENRATGLYTGVTRAVRLEGGRSEQLQGRGNWLIGAIEECH